MATMQQGSLLFSLKYASGEKRTVQEAEIERALEQARHSAIEAGLARARANAERRAREDADRPCEAGYGISARRRRGREEEASLLFQHQPGILV